MIAVNTRQKNDQLSSAVVKYTSGLCFVWCFCSPCGDSPAKCHEPQVFFFPRLCYLNTECGEAFFLINSVWKCQGVGLAEEVNGTPRQSPTYSGCAGLTKSPSPFSVLFVGIYDVCMMIKSANC